MKKKVAVLGGGVGALTAAFELSADPACEITVYQMGWRLGGKGASGRNAEEHNRIEEHGLHIFMGFYENAFRMMNEVYRDCNDRGLTPDSPFQSFRDAFSRLNLIVLTDDTPNGWELWPMQLPASDDMPGTEREDPREGIKSFFIRLLSFALEKVLESLRVPHPLVDSLANAARLLEAGGLRRLATNVLVRTASGASSLFGKALSLHSWARVIPSLVDRVLRLSRAMDPNAANIFAARVQKRYLEVRPLEVQPDVPDDELIRLFTDVDRLCRQVLRAGAGLIAGLDPEVRRKLLIADVALTILRGMIRDRLLDGSFDKINDLDLAEWLEKSSPIFPARNVLVRAFYDAAFAYEGGQFTSGGMNLAAGSGLYGILRLLLTYRGSIMWRMEAGMGDTIFAPLYLLLKARGVKFEFFHKVTNLGLSADKREIDEIDIDVQARPNNGEYDPLVHVPESPGSARRIPCWPSEPDFGQLVEGDDLRSASLRNADLESAWTDWVPKADKKVLRRGADFDVVVLGISPGALPHIAKELIARPETPSVTPNFAALKKWQDMIGHLKLVRTQSLQLWMKRGGKELGWDPSGRGDERFTERPLLCSFVEPFDTWCDMSHLLPREAFDPQTVQLAYFCNAAPADPSEAPFDRHDYPALQKSAGATAGVRFLDRDVKVIWPLGIDPARAGQFDRTHIVAEYFRVNLEPSELYVLSVKGSAKYRLAPGESGFNNLFLAGDWTRNILDLGCVEAAVISGKLAAAAVTQTRPQIHGLVGAKIEELLVPKAATA